MAKGEQVFRNMATSHGRQISALFLNWDRIGAMRVALTSSTTFSLVGIMTLFTSDTCASEL